MVRLWTLATEAGGGELPIGEQIRGYLVVVAAVTLFCGSIYMLLATDVGKRLGFLISFATLTGFLCMLGLIWFTNLTPLNALHGPGPHWNVHDVVENLADTEVEAARDITETGDPIPEADQGEIKASLDTTLTESGGEFAKYSSADQYVVLDAFERGGGTSGFLKLGHATHYATMTVQGVKEVEPLPGQAPPPPTADSEKPKYTAVLIRDLGSLRQPPLFMSLAFGILFAITLKIMHDTERAKQRAEMAPAEPAPEPEPALT